MNYADIGFIGTGSMGLPMAENLLKAGFSLAVYNRTAEKAQPLINAGARLANSPKEAIQPGEIAITMVADDAALEAVTFGENGFGETLGENGVHLSMSTVSPATADKLAAYHYERGSRYVAAPVFGRPDAAAAKKLWICVSGDESAKARIRPLLEAVGQGIFDFGVRENAANVVKLCGNFLIASAIESIGESLLLAEQNGIERTAVIEMLAATLFACPIYQNYGRQIAGERFTPAGFQLKLGLKDLSLVEQTASSSDTEMPFAQLLKERFQTAVEHGRGEMDWTALTLELRKE